MSIEKVRKLVIWCFMLHNLAKYLQNEHMHKSHLGFATIITFFLTAFTHCTNKCSLIASSQRFIYTECFRITC
nr:unnamed protein product [Callosobruchus chinensis]